ncbi:hypothetical protein O1W68_20450 [Rhodococcus sp. H36-A4]|nr:hypothetical protein [Rhodococcus sp. H36-A4]MCZ4080322.1 hypothetical protein [Rhodococcus sp. H36-A4]
MTLRSNQNVASGSHPPSNVDRSLSDNKIAILGVVEQAGSAISKGVD